MTHDETVSVRIFGVLRAIRLAQGLPATTSLVVPTQGVSAGEVAEDLGLPLERIEGVFCNHTIYSLDHVVRPGDAIAFVPFGTPGPHRIYLGLREAGRKSE